MPINYRDFDLLIERAGNAYKARVVDSPAGEAVTALVLPFSESDVEQFFVQIGHSRLIESPQTQKMREFGQLLFEATFSGDVRDRLRESLNEVTRNGEGLRIRLRTGDIPELTNLPWEFMYDASLGRFLALSIETPLVRYLDIPRDIQPLAIRPPLRILAMISSPRDFPTLNVQKEWENLQESLSRLESRGMVALTRLEKPTLQMLQRQLRREHYHIFHFIGHGVFSKQYQDGFLLFEDEMREGHRVSSRDLGILLHDHPSLRLAVLNACEGARISLEDQFSGTAQNLMQQGLPAVIAMQFRITDIAAITLAREFYAALADGYPVDAALTEARKAIKTHGNDLEWGTPVLYMRSPNGQIFDVAAIPQTWPDDTRITDDTHVQYEHVERLYTEALEAFYLEKWELALQKFQAVIDVHPKHIDATTKLETVKHNLQLLGLDERAINAEKGADWETAVHALEALAEKEPNFSNVTERLANARRQKQLGDLYTEACQLMEAGKWQAAINIFNKMAVIDPKAPDPRGLRAQAERNLAESKKQSELDKTYNQALHALDNGQLRSAIKSLQRVRKLQAGYRETDLLLKRAEAELARTKKEKTYGKSEVDTASKVQKFEGLTLASFGSFALARLLAELVLGGKRFDWFAGLIGQTITFILLTSMLGALMGAACWWGLRKIYLKLNKWQDMGLFLSFAFAVAAPLTIAREVSSIITDEWIWTVSWSISGLLVGLTLSLYLRKVEPGFGMRQFWFTMLGWEVAFFIGQQVGRQVIPTLTKTMHNSYLRDLAGWTIEEGITGMIGVAITLYQLPLFQSIRVNWKTVGVAAVAFSLSNGVVNTIYKSGYEMKFGQLFFWGLLGGAFLAYPSKDFKRYLVMGCFAGIGMYLGYQLYKALDYNFYLACMGLTLGVLVGVPIWLETKRPFNLLLFMLITLTAFAFRQVLYRWVTYLIYSVDLNKIITSITVRDILKSAISASFLGITLGATCSMIANKTYFYEEK
jgi:outer membrane protein assembly factor BamD (BamD/ComL family)